MNYLRVKNWEQYQRYRKDRGAPPWIALHRKLQRDPEWVMLTSEQRGWLVDIWMLAAERNGLFPADPKVLKVLCGMHEVPDLSALSHFIEGVDVQCHSSGRPMDCPETETYTETEEIRDMSGSESPAAPPKPDRVRLVFEHWQSVMNHPKAKLDDKRRRVINARLKDGYTVEDMTEAIDGCAKSKFHMGDNDRGERYDSLGLILRNADQIDKFRRLASGEYVPQTEEDKLAAWAAGEVH